MHVLSNVLLTKIICGALRDSRPLGSLQNTKCTCAGMLFFSKVAAPYFTLTLLKITL